MWACIGLLFLNPGEKKMIDVDGKGDHFYPPEVGKRVPFFCYVLAAYVLIAGVSGSLLLQRNSIQKLKDKVSFRRTHNTEKARRHSMDAFLTDIGSNKDYMSVRDAVRTTQFKLLICLFCLLSLGQLLLIMNVKGFVLQNTASCIIDRKTAWEKSMEEWFGIYLNFSVAVGLMADGILRPFFGLS